MKFRKFSDFSVTYVLLGSSDFQHEKVFSKVGQKMTKEMESSTCKKTMEEHRVIDPEIIYTRLRHSIMTRFSSCTIRKGKTLEFSTGS